MVALDERSLEEVFSFYKCITQCDSFSALQHFAVEPLAERLGAHSAIVLNFRSADGGFSEPVQEASVDICPEHTERYVERFFEKDPTVKLLHRIQQRGAPMGTFYRTSECHDAHTYWKSAYARDFLQSTGIKDFMVLAVTPPHQERNHFIIGFHRHNHENSFSSEDKKLADMVAPAFNATLTSIVRRREVDRTSAALDVILTAGSSTQLVLVLDQHLNIQHQSGTLPGIEAKDLDQACLQLSMQIKSMKQNQTAFLGRHEVCFALEAMTHVFRGTIFIQKTISKNEAPHFVACIERTDDVQLQDKSTLWKLTPREKEVTAHIANGSSNALIAKRLNISVKTVENHLVSIYGKAKVFSRAQLIAKLQ